MQNNGFTLIETVIYSALVGIVITGFITFGLLMLGINNKNYVMEEVNASARTAINIISINIKKANQVSSPGVGSTRNILVLDLSGDVLTIKAINNILIQDEAGVVNNITSNQTVISNLSFTNLGSAEKDNIRVTFDLSFKDADSLEYSYSKSYQTAVSLRK